MVTLRLQQSLVVTPCHAGSLGHTTGATWSDSVMASTHPPLSQSESQMSGAWRRCKGREGGVCNERDGEGVEVGGMYAERGEKIQGSLA